MKHPICIENHYLLKITKNNVLSTKAGSTVRIFSEAFLRMLRGSSMLTEYFLVYKLSLRIKIFALRAKSAACASTHCHYR